jgi:outer membrane protein OmpA-like peptidoglycan-associated protein
MVVSWATARQNRKLGSLPDTELMEENLMKLRVAFISLAVMLCGVAAWSQQTPKVELSGDYSYSHYGAIDYESQTYQYGQWYTLNGGGLAFVYNFGSKLGLRADFQGYESDKRVVVFPPGNPFLPQGGSISTSGDLFTYMFGPQLGIRHGVFRPYVIGLVGGANTNLYSKLSTAVNFAGGSKSNDAFAADAGFGLDIAVGRHLSLRPFELSYLYTNFSSKLNLGANQNSSRYVGGLVFNFGGKPPIPVSATCSANPATVMVGEPVTVTAAGANFNPKRTLTYAWTVSDGKLSSTDAATATVDTTGLSDGTHTANVTITDPKGSKKNNASSCGANFNVNVPHNPPQVTCSASPTSVKPGESSTITASATSPDKSNIAGYTYAASAGTVSGSGTTATLDTSSQPGGSINITVTATDARGLAGTCTASVEVVPPPPPPPPPPPSLTLHSVFFPTDQPTKAKPEGGLVESQEQMLTTLATDFKNYLQVKSDARITLTGHADKRGTPEFNQALSERRVARVKSFLVEQGVPEASIDTRALGEEQNLTEEQVKDLVDKNPELTDEQRKKADSQMKAIVWAQNRRVDITLNNSNQEPVLQYPFNAADAMTLLKGGATTPAKKKAPEKK